MTATSTGQDTRQVPGLGLIEFEEQPYRRYWFTPETGGPREQMLSVTTILRDSWPKPQLVDWAAKQGENMYKIRDQAGERGRELHRFIETWTGTGRLLDKTEFAPEHQPYIAGAAAFLFDHDPQPEAVEQLVCFPEQGYAGRLDLRARVDGKSTILDFKTSKDGRVYAEAHVQTYAYQLADERCGAPPVDQRLIIGITPTGQYTLTQGAEAADLWQTIINFDKWRRQFVKGLGRG